MEQHFGHKTDHSQFSIICDQLPPHTMCLQEEEDEITVFKFEWKEVSCVAQLDGPVIVYDYRKLPGKTELYQGIDDAIIDMKNLFH